MIKKYLPISLIALVLVGTGVFVYRVYMINKSNTSDKTYKSNLSDSFAKNNQSKSIEPLSYTHPDLGFTISYPGNYAISKNMADDQGETILLQNNGKGAQIYISDFSGSEFNSAIVRRELAQEKLNNLKDIVMPAGNFNAVSFSGKDPALGEVWDVWFVKNGKLYQITSQSGQDQLLKSLVESFKFE